MKKIITIYIALFIVISLNAQVKFQKSHGGAVEESAIDMIVNNNGEYVYCGFTASYGAGDKDLYLVKTDTDGDTLFVRTFGGNGIDDATAVNQTTDNGYIVVGTTESYGAGNSDIILVKTDVNGNLVWSKTYGTNFTDLGYGVQQTNDGGYILTGATFTVADGYESVVVKTNPTGDTLWTKKFGTASGLNDIAYEIVEVSGGYIFAGFSIHTFPANENIYAVKLNTTGGLVWAKKWGGNGNDYGYAMTKTTDGNIAIAGATNSYGAGDYDMWIVKLNQNGDTLWSKAYGGPGAEFARAIEEDSDGGLLIAGYTNGFNSVQNDAIVIKTDAQGNFVWGKTYGKDGNGYEEARSINPLSDKGYIIAGYTDSYGQGQGDAYLVRIDSLKLSSCNEFDITPTVTPNSPNSANNTNVGSTGYIVQSINPTWGAQNTIVETICYCDGQLTNADYTESITGLNVDFTDQSSGVPTAWNWDFGDSNTSTQQNPSHTYASSGKYNVCLTATNDCGSDVICDSVTVDSIVGINEVSKTVDLQVYPNPASDFVVIKAHDDIYQVQLLNIIGEVIIAETNVSKRIIKLNTESLISGTYLLQVTTRTGEINQKIFIE